MTARDSGEGLRSTPPGSLIPAPAPASASSYEEAVLIAGGPVAWPRRVESEPHVPDLAFVRERMPERADKTAYLLHALRFFEDVLAYAERLEAAAGSEAVDE